MSGINMSNTTMTNVSISFDWDLAALEFGTEAAGLTELAAKRFAPVEGGALKARLTATPLLTSHELWISLGSDVPYFDYVRKGTKTPIYPKHSLLLVSSHPADMPRHILGKSVRGQAANPFIQLAELATREEIKIMFKDRVKAHIHKLRGTDGRWQ